MRSNTSNLDENSLTDLRKVLKNNILNNKECSGYIKEKSEVLQLIQRTVQCGESNSALLVGSRSSGKTMMVNQILSELKSISTFTKDSIVVKLHGLVHTDDKLALKSITSQMQLENVVDGKVFGTFAENLSFLLACLRTGEKRTSKSIIFILDEFDLFCFHHNQTLLYNLFDVSQSAQTPVCILGITCRLDVPVLLEKRVKSRFSHRQIFLVPGLADPDKALEYMLDRVRYYLVLPDKCHSDISKSVKKNWNETVNKLVKDKKFKQLIQRLADIDVNESTLKNILIKVIFNMKGPLTINDFEEELNALEVDETLLILQDLSILELCLLIAMKHHAEIYQGKAMNFEMILSRYNKFVKCNSNIQNFPRSVIMKAFEHIQSLELISMISGGGTKTQKEYRFFELLVMPTQISEAIKKNPEVPTEVVQWANSSLTCA
ncbi:origin recognition complex subunit 4 isoform X1 [Diabrotica virgifera virgifera]|uniref:Origin recognition complex subunit 4 n=2 Tax=Diabrotica virgifera virgifera TaxID=50390 RepID=A0ABM5JXL8_DIAVI|nr:origin recognition complex subunit 4 isoform X1 [Diabrotica virgifera virgifera]